MNTTHDMTPRAQTKPERVQQRAFVAPLVDVYENERELLLVIDVPGATRDAVTVHLEGDELTIDARRGGEPATPGALVLCEYRPADYHRIFSVPRGIDASKIEAELTSGVLRVRLPKSETMKPRRIEVKAS